MSEYGIWNGARCVVLRRFLGTDGKRYATIQTNVDGAVQRVVTIPDATFAKAQLSTYTKAQEKSK